MSFEEVSRRRLGPTEAQMRARLAALSRLSWCVGVTGDEAAAPFIDRRTGTPAGPTVAGMAAIHEFGVNVPERPFMQIAFEQILPDLRNAGALVHVAPLFGQGAEVMREIGERHVRQIRGLLLGGQDLEELSPRTLADPERDPRGLPLVDTEQILGSIQVKER